MLLAQLFESERVVLREALVNLHLVEYDGAVSDVLWAIRGNLSLPRQIQEGFTIDLEREGVHIHVVVQGKIPPMFFYP